jgi:hypothetical protein
VDADRIHGRPDEQYRRAALAGGASGAGGAG